MKPSQESEGFVPAATLQVAPLFAIHGLPKTPDAGESFTGGPGSEITRRELQALFSVVGTPCWADVAAVQESSWRRYLHHLPGRAPTLYRRFAAAGEAAVDLLSRLLAFDPTRRCSPDEALAHEYFSGVVPEGGELSGWPARGLCGWVCGGVCGGVGGCWQLRVHSTAASRCGPGSCVGPQLSRVRCWLQWDVRQPLRGGWLWWGGEL